MFHDDGCALLLGIDDYSAFDRSTGQVSGTSDLEGSRNDVHVFWRLCVELGMRPENIRVLTSPPIDLVRLPGATAANVGEATEAGVRAALAWLADKLAGGRAGLLTYSGHGAHTTARGLLLCPSDVTGAAFDHAIPLTDLRTVLGDAATSLTVVLDCCHGGAHVLADERGRRAQTLGGDPIPEGGCRSDLQIGARVLAACEPGEMTVQADFNGLAHGAFSWAVAAIADQWKRVGEGGNVRLDLSYGTLVDKARKLLAVLDFPGTPAVYGPKGVAALSVMQLGRRPEATRAAPDGNRRGMQMDPGEKALRFYKITDVAANTVVAKVAVPNTSVTLSPPGGPVKCDPGSEYWFDVAKTPPAFKKGALITWKDYSQDDTLPTPSKLSFTMTQAATWKSLQTAMPPVSAANLANTDLGVVFSWRLSYDQNTSIWGGSVQWYYPTGQSNVFEGAMPSSGVTLSPQTSPGPTWYFAEVSPAQAPLG